MKSWSSEFSHNYGSYSFGYCEYGEIETGDSLSDLLSEGYLPYSGSPDVQDICYRARSSRLHLPSFEMNSENRRIYKKFEQQFEYSIKQISDVSKSPETITFITDYFKAAHGDVVMPEKRLMHVLDHAILQQVVEYTHNGTPVGYILEGGDAHATLYWFSAYDTAYLKQALGMWLMIDAVLRAKNAGKQYIYLGTVYGEKALYKANFSDIEWWNGASWSTDPKNTQLRARAKSDSTRVFDGESAWSENLKKF
jgi:arginyl-tRNA--protein-N-Asp/Glu arginylyltransferase